MEISKTEYGTTRAKPKRRVIRAFVAGAAALMIVGVAHAEDPVAGRNMPLYDGATVWRYDESVGEKTLTVSDQASGETIATYDVTECGFCARPEDNCDMNGIFPVLHGENRDEAVLGLVCHIGAHSQKFVLFSPRENAEEPIAEIAGAYSVDLSIQLTGLRVRADGYTPDKIEELAWTGKAMTDPPEIFPFPETRLSPPDISNAGVEDVIAKLRDIVADRDFAALTAMMDPGVGSSFGGNGGIDEFTAYWEIGDDPAASPLWDELDRVIGFGPAVSTEPWELIVFPYFFYTWPDELDAWDFYAIPGTDIPLRAGPAVSAPILRRLSGDPVKGVYADYATAYESDAWLFVHTWDGQLGYVRSDDAAAILDYRLLVEKLDGEWLITWFVAGD